MMTYLIFPTRAEAIAADRRIALNFGMGDNARDETTRYQSEKQQLDGSWYLATPPAITAELPPVYTPGPTIDTPTGPQPTGTWFYPSTQSDSLLGVVGYTRAKSVAPMPPPKSDMQGSPA